MRAVNVQRARPLPNVQLQIIAKHAMQAITLTEPAAPRPLVKMVSLVERTVHATRDTLAVEIGLPGLLHTQRAQRRIRAQPVLVPHAPHVKR